MTLRTDHSFHIGEQHLKNGKPAQDYALSGKLSENLAYAIVSDGCSSGGMTDIGARLMTLATKEALTGYTEIADILTLEDPIATVNGRRDELFESYRNALGLDYRDLLATSVWMVSSKDMALAHITGDGVVAFQHEYDLRIEHTKWAQNRPYYPVYKLASMNEDYEAMFAADPEPFTVVCESTSPGQGGVPDGYLSNLSVKVGMDGFITFGGGTSEVWPGKLLSAAIFSDGVEQVDGLSMTETVKQLMAFKSTRGQFAVRRMNRFLAEAKKVGRGPIDDIAMAVIHLDDETKT